MRVSMEIQADAPSSSGADGEAPSREWPMGGPVGHPVSRGSVAVAAFPMRCYWRIRHLQSHCAGAAAAPLLCWLRAGLSTRPHRHGQPNVSGREVRNSLVNAGFSLGSPGEVPGTSPCPQGLHLVKNVISFPSYRFPRRCRCPVLPASLHAGTCHPVHLLCAPVPGTGFRLSYSRASELMPPGSPQSLARGNAYLQVGTSPFTARESG